LLHPDVRREYAAIVIDIPPRLALGAVNALFASHYFLAPTILDKLSGVAVQRFIAQVREIKNDAQLDLDLAGIIGSMTRVHPPSGNEAEIWEATLEMGAAWAPGRDYRLGTIPRKATITNVIGDDG
jgi:cellulose biosynthesis protein BcsQ